MNNKYSGATLILEERYRQVLNEGYNISHDLQHNRKELGEAALCYLSSYLENDMVMPVNWPFESSWWKPTDRIKNLVKAGALIAAEIDRLNNS